MSAVRQEAYCNIASKLYNDIVNEIVVAPARAMSSPPAPTGCKGGRLNEAFMPYAIFGWDAENWYVTE